MTPTIMPRSQQADLLAGMQGLGAGGHHDLSRFQAIGDRHGRGIVAQHLDVAQRDGQRRGVDDQTAGRRSNSVGAEAGISMAGAVSSCTRPVTLTPRRMAAGGSVRATLTSNVRVTGSACGETSRTRPTVVTLGSSVSLTSTLGCLGADRSI